jgi:hypothetical protein
MILSTLLITNIIWILYSLTEGVREGFYWHYENKSKRVCDFNINPIFHLQRSLVLLLTGGLLVHTLGWFSLLSLVCMIMMFSFFHNGTYYYTRNKLQPGTYPKGWSDESKSFPPFHTSLYTYKKRTISLILGLASQIFVYIFLLS